MQRVAHLEAEEECQAPEGILVVPEPFGPVV